MQVERRRFLQQAALGSAGCVLAASSLAARSPAHVVATTRSGRVGGVREQGVQVFRGIRYGADTAPRRFQPALQEAPWRGVRDALAYAASAPQNGHGLSLLLSPIKWSICQSPLLAPRHNPAP